MRFNSAREVEIISEYNTLVGRSLKAAGDDAEKAREIMVQAIRNDPLLRAALRQDVLSRKAEFLGELASLTRSGMSEERAIEIAQRHGFSSPDDVRMQEHLADGAPEAAE